MSEDREDDPFPESKCLEIFAELSVWTSVDDCLAAARAIEGRSSPEDMLSAELIIPYPDDDGFETVLLKGFEWLIQRFRVPASKIRLASYLDPEIAPDTCAALSDARFRPDIKKGPAGAIAVLYPALAAHRDERFFVVKDAPHVIELVQNPIRCFTGILLQVWPQATELRAIRHDAAKTGGAPTIYHQPYTDGPLFALIEALAFYVNGLQIGPNAMQAPAAVNRGYRSVEVVGRPPLDPQMFDVAQKLTKEMFRSLE